MAATKTVDERAQLRNPSILDILRVPRHGVVTLFGYGITIRVDRGHLMVEDGIGCDRRQARLPRVGHGLRRLVVIGADGMISLAALRWLADQNAAFVMLDRDGRVLATTGPVHPSDARLRRAQALADQSGAALRIVRELISQKLAGQEQVARDKFCDSETARTIGNFRTAVATAETLQAVRTLEAQAGVAYWSVWRNLPINYPKSDVQRVPDHWRFFGTRESPLSGSPRRSANPPNAMLNYLYALLESEARLAVATLGLDPGLGFLHVDSRGRDSLACDLMEPVRPLVDAFVLDWIVRMPVTRQWFFEQRDGTCRLMGSFAVQLSETVPAWRSVLAPLAESVARTLWLTVAKSTRNSGFAPRLTQSHRRQAKGNRSLPPAEPLPQAQNICRLCGASITITRTYCDQCVTVVSTEHMLEAARTGQVAAQSAAAQAGRAETQRRHAAEKRDWLPTTQPVWLNKETYVQKIQPLLANITISTIASALGVSAPYAAIIRAGKRLPHPRHWQTLAQLVGVSKDA